MVSETSLFVISDDGSKLGTLYQINSTKDFCCCFKSLANLCEKDKACLSILQYTVDTLTFYCYSDDS